MKLIKALEIALELYERGEICTATQEVKETIYMGCASTDPDLYYFLFNNTVNQGLRELLDDEHMDKAQEGIVNKIQKEIERQRGKNISGRRGDALYEMICIIGANLLAVDEDDKEVLKKLNPFINLLMDTPNFPPEPPNPNEVLKALNSIDEDVYDLIMANIFFIKGMTDRHYDHHIPQNADPSNPPPTNPC